MFKPSRYLAFTISLLILSASLSRSAHAQAPTAPDSTLYTTYQIFGSSIDATVCGSTQQSEGCYGGGQLGPFGIIGSLLESQPIINGNVVTRGIYVVDIGAGSGSSVALYVYKKTDTISASYDQVSITLQKTIALPLTGGAGAVSSMAANASFLFIGTNLSNSAIEVSKSNYSTQQAGAFDAGVTSITADSYGYVTITQGNGFAVYGPNGSIQEDGGGSPFMLNTINAVGTSTLP